MSEYDDIAGGLSERDVSRASVPGQGQAGVTGVTPSTARSESTSRLDGGEIGAEPVEHGVAPQQPPTRKRKRTRHVPPPSSRGRCTADAPAGTRCKICGNVHPQREGRSVKIHVPDRDVDAKTDFK